MIPTDQANLRAAPTFDKLKARQLVRVKREVATNNHAVSWKGFVIGRLEMNIADGVRNLS